MEDMNETLKCIFDGCTEEVSLIPVDTSNNLQPVCIGCYEAFLNACRSSEPRPENEEL